MRSILLLPLVDRCLETIDVCMYVAHVCFYVGCMIVWREVCGKVCCVVAVVENSFFF